MMWVVKFAISFRKGDKQGEILMKFRPELELHTNETGNVLRKRIPKGWPENMELCFKYLI